MTVHPEFDPLTCTWFVPEGQGVKAEAKSLRELKRLLPHGTQIVGYKPLGVSPWQPPKQGDSTSSRSPRAAVAGLSKPVRHTTNSAVDLKTPAVVKPPLPVKRYAYDDVLDLWVLGYNAEYISRKLKIDRRRVGQIVFDRRKFHRDPRAIKHTFSAMTTEQLVNRAATFNPDGPDIAPTVVDIVVDKETEFWTIGRVDEMLRLLGRGYSASQTAMEIGTTRNAVIGKRDRIRKEQAQRQAAVLLRLRRQA